MGSSTRASEPARGAKGVRHEVRRPAVAGHRGQGHRPARATGPLAAPPAPDRQAFLAARPMQRLGVRQHAPAPRQQSDAPIAAACGAVPRPPAWPCGFPDRRAAACAAPSSDRHRSERRPGVARCHDPASPSARRPAAPSVSSGLSPGPWTSGVPWLRSQEILQHSIVGHGIRQKPRSVRFSFSGALSPWALDTSMSPYLAPMPGPELVERGRAESVTASVLATNLRRRHSGFLLLDTPR